MTLKRTKVDEVFTARVAAVVDFVNQVEAAEWRKHVLITHAPSWPWRLQGKELNATQAA